MPISRRFTEHPATVGESYGEHFLSAVSFSGTMFKAAICCAIHAVLPFMFERTGRVAVSRLHDRMVVNRDRLQRIEQNV